jgi:hypothetical protein
MVSDMAQPSGQLWIPMLSLLLISNLIKGLMLSWHQDMNILV